MTVDTSTLSVLAEADRMEQRAQPRVAALLRALLDEREHLKNKARPIVGPPMPESVEKPAGKIMPDSFHH